MSARKKMEGEKGSLVFPFGEKNNPLTSKNDISFLRHLLRPSLYIFAI